MILNKFIRFISLASIVKFPALTINFALFREHLARFATTLTGQDTNKFTENERNTGRCTAQSSRKVVNG